LQNFQARKRLLDYDDVMNQQREVVYSLRSFALEGGEELKGEALKMIDKAITFRVETNLAEFEDAAQWDFDLLRQDLLMRYLVQVPEYESADHRPTEEGAAQKVAVDAAKKAFWAKLESLDKVLDENGQPYGDRLLSLVMLNVLDEKWKDHLYDLDQLRNAIHYRSWGQKDPLIEYKQEAYTMFVDLMNDIYNTFSERFLKVQLIVEPPPPPPPSSFGGTGGPRTGPTKRYNALGILEDIPAEESVSSDDGGAVAVEDVGPAEIPAIKPAQARKDPVIVGAGRARSLSSASPAPANVDWSTVGRNDPCPCGSGKKFKKCHGAQL
jgi:preprotein translocase subunit SecA